VFEARTAIFVRAESGEIAPAHATAGFEPPAKEIGIVQWAWSNRREAGHGTDTVPGGAGFYVPLPGPSAAAGVVGVLGIFPQDPGRFSDPEQRRLADALATQMAMAMERVGHRPLLVEGAESNIKITTRADLALAEFLIEEMGAEG